MGFLVRRGGEKQRDFTKLLNVLHRWLIPRIQKEGRLCVKKYTIFSHIHKFQRESNIYDGIISKAEGLKQRNFAINENIISF